MNIRIINLLICLLLAAATGAARDVAAFCDGWEFKKGPFPADAMKGAGKWNSNWEAVTIPHTWNATDMQKKASSYYAGEAYYRKRFTPILS